MNATLPNPPEFVTTSHGITYSGLHIYPECPSIGAYELADIAHALSNLCRFGGHSTVFYSVAQHSVLMAMQFDDIELQKAALMHDATEAYCQDLIRAVKHMLPAYKAIEEGFWRALAERFGLPSALPPEVKVMDNRMLVTEKQQLINSVARWDLEDSYEPCDVEIVPWTPHYAERRFLELARTLFPNEFPPFLN